MLRNFIWQREDEPQNMLAYLFLFVNLCYGITFTFFSNTSIVTSSPFYMAGVPPVLWGVACLTLVALTLTTIYNRNQYLGEWMGMLGVCVWSYGLTLYMISGGYFASAVVYLPQILFWTFWYIGVKRFYKKI